MKADSQRVISLVPSLTETLLDWGITPIACTRFCEQPTLAHVGGTKDPDLSAIVSLAPTMVLMDREENRREDAEALSASGIEVFATHVTSVADVAPTLVGLRKRLGLAEIELVMSAVVVVQPVERTAFVAIWRRPWMTCNAGTYGSSLLASIGVTNVFADQASTYPVVELVDVADLRPDLVVLPSEPYPFAARHVGEVSRAVPGSEVCLVDGRDLFWWGTRTQRARTRLAQALGADGGASGAVVGESDLGAGPNDAVDHQPHQRLEVANGGPGAGAEETV